MSAAISRIKPQHRVEMTGPCPSTVSPASCSLVLIDLVGKRIHLSRLVPCCSSPVLIAIIPRRGTIKHEKLSQDTWHTTVTTTTQHHRNKTKAKQEAALSVGETLWQSRQVLRALVVQIPSLAAMILQFPAVTKENLITNLTLSIIEGDEFGQLEGTEIYWGQVTVRYGASASQ